VNSGGFFYFDRRIIKSLGEGNITISVAQRPLWIIGFVVYSPLDIVIGEEKGIKTTKSSRGRQKTIFQKKNS